MTAQPSPENFHDVVCALCSQFQPLLIDDPPSTVTQTFLIVPVIVKKGRAGPGESGRARARALALARVVIAAGADSLELVEKKKKNYDARARGGSIRGKIMAIYYRRD